MNRLDSPKNKFIEKLERLAIKNGIYRVFDDFCTISTCVIGSRSGKPELEKRYVETVSKYDCDELEELMKMFALFTVMVGAEPFKDLLGELYMLLKISQGKMGQFFTPQHISDFTARLPVTRNEILKEVCLNGILRVKEPCSGGGSMVLGFAKHVAGLGLNPQNLIYFDCNDIDPLCVNMTYIQLSLNGLKGRVTRGNGLNDEILEEFITPA